MTQPQKIKKLEADIIALKDRIVALEARPPISIITLPASYDAAKPVSPNRPNWPGWPNPYVGDWPLGSNTTSG